MKNWLNNTILTSRKRYIVISIVLLIVVISSSLIFFSYAYYENRSNNLLITGSATIGESDIRLRVFLQNTNSSGTPISSYSEIRGEIPSNYVFNPEKSGCTSGVSIYEVNKNIVTLESNKKGSCSIYMDLASTDADITVKLYAQTSTGYEAVSTVPTDKQYGVNTRLSDCSGNAEVLADGSIAAKGVATCTVVYDEVVDLDFKIYLQDKDSSGNALPSYSLSSGTIPSNYIYNPSKTKCSDGVSVSEVSKNNFSIVSSKIGSCSVYLDAVTTDADITAKLYVKNETGIKAVNTLPTDDLYIANTKLSDCSGNAEVLDDGSISAKGVATCAIVYEKFTTGKVPKVAYTNDATYPYTWDDAKGTWTSGNKGVPTSTSTITFTAPKAGAYTLYYTHGGESTYDYATVTKSGTVILNLSNKKVTTETAFSLGTLTKGQTIVIAYKKDGSVDTAPDSITFYIEAN